MQLGEGATGHRHARRCSRCPPSDRFIGGLRTRRGLTGRITGLGIENHDQVRRRGDDLAVADGEEVLVLETELERGAGVGALDPGLASGEAS